jgi:hypothetical protein
VIPGKHNTEILASLVHLLRDVKKQKAPSNLQSTKKKSLEIAATQKRMPPPRRRGIFVRKSDGTRAARSPGPPEVAITIELPQLPGIAIETIKTAGGHRVK